MRALRRRFLLPLLAVLAAVPLLTACPPIAQAVVDVSERNDDASLTYVTQGIAFDPGSSAALGAILIIQGTNLSLLSVPEGAECNLAEDEIDCRLGTVQNRTTVGLTGQGVIANVTWRRAGSATVYLLFARTAVEGGGG